MFDFAMYIGRARNKIVALSLWIGIEGGVSYKQNIGWYIRLHKYG